MRLSLSASRVSTKIAGVVAATLFVVLLTPARSEATTIFSTTYAWNGTDSIQPFGNPNTATYGQTFIAPTDNVLDSFTFYLNGGATLQFVAQVYNWSGPIQGNGGGATGPALFTSSTMNLGPTNGFVPVTANTGGVPLVAGNQYVALFTISNPVDYAASSGTDVWGSLGFGNHAAGNGGGGFVFYNNGNNPGLLNTTTWDTFADFGDVAWDASFSSPVPEPTSLLLLGTGLVLAVRRLRASRASRS